MIYWQRPAESVDTQLNLWLGAFCQLQSDNLGIKDGIFASKDSLEVVPCFQGQIRCSDKKCDIGSIVWRRGGVVRGVIKYH